MGWVEAELSVTLIGDRAMARLNRETFRRPGPTNVIAFPVDRPSPPQPSGPKPESGDRAKSPLPPPVLGEVVVSVETTRREAQMAGWPWEELLDFYLIHGILHLIGYEHDNPKAKAAMTAKTWELLEMIREKGD